MKNPLVRKITALVAVITLLVLGLGRIESVVQDRALHRRLATQGVAQSLTGPQTLLGPLLHLACVESWEVLEGNDKERRPVEHRRESRYTLPPSQLTLVGAALPQALQRGLYPVQTYLLEGRLQARWDPLDALRPRAQEKNGRLQCGAPVLMLALSDTRGLRSARLQVADQALALKPGTFHPTYTHGLHAVLPDAVRHQSEPLQVQLDLELTGTEQLAVVPLGEQTEVQLRSPWPHPSFGGHFLPSQRSVGAQGFEARWRLSALATSTAQDVADAKPLCTWTWRDAGAGEEVAAPTTAASGCVQSLHVRLIDPVNPYTLADRAIKYGLLFVLLTFVGVGLVELLERRAVHPVQYLLVGCALSAFFLLLLSLSEHLPFAWAYAGASAACVLLLGYYGAHMLGRWARGAALGAGMALLYGVLFVLLRLEQTALLVGSLALFAVLTSVMVLTRRVNWYALGSSARAG